MEYVGICIIRIIQHRLYSFYTWFPPGFYVSIMGAFTDRIEMPKLFVFIY